MKKILIAALCLCILCCGCAAPKPPEAVPLTVSVETVRQETKAEDGSLLLERSFPRFSLEGTSAQAIHADLQIRIDNWIAASADLASFAQSEYKAETIWTPWFAKLESHIERLDSRVFSIYFTYSEFTGGNHPSLAAYSVTYDCTAGKVLELRNLLEYSPTVLASLVNDVLAPQANNLYDDYEALVGKAFSDDDIQWYLSDEGLCFHFAPYAIGPYSSGIITATVAYDQLSGFLHSEYLPK